MSEGQSKTQRKGPRMWVGAAAGMCHVRTVHVQVLALLLSEHLPKELSVGCFCCDVEVMARSGVRLGPKVEIVGARLCRSKGWIHWAGQTVTATVTESVVHINLIQSLHFIVISLFPAILIVLE